MSFLCCGNTTPLLQKDNTYQERLFFFSLSCCHQYHMKWKKPPHFFTSSLFVLFAAGRNTDREGLKWGKRARTGKCYNTTSQCEDWDACFMLFLFYPCSEKYNLPWAGSREEECVWWLIPFCSEMTVGAVRVAVEWPKVGWICHFWLWIYAGLGETKEAKDTSPILKKSDLTRWDKKSIWEVRYCWVGCWGWRNRGDHADSRYIEPYKVGWAKEVKISKAFRDTKHINFRGYGEARSLEKGHGRNKRKGEQQKPREKKEQRRASERGFMWGKIQKRRLLRHLESVSVSTVDKIVGKGQHLMEKK